MKRIAILQSNYLPWKGYFDLIARVDEFHFYDCAQYTRSDWRNRNLVKTPAGKRWISVPVRREWPYASIDRTQIAQPDVLQRHWDLLRNAYRGAAAFRAMEEEVAALFHAPVPRFIGELNRDRIRRVCTMLGIGTPLFEVDPAGLSDDRNRRLVGLCLRRGATHYLTGPAARDYLDEAVFAAAGITVEWMEYAGYREYAQPHPPFDHHVSIVDLLLCTGRAAPAHLLQARAGDTPCAA